METSDPGNAKCVLVKKEKLFKAKITTEKAKIVTKLDNVHEPQHPCKTNPDYDKT